MADASSARLPRLTDVDPVDDLLARLRLDSVARGDGVLIVEGPSDRRALSSALGVDTRRIFQVAGRPNVLRCVRRLAERPLGGVVCLADRDFDESEENWPGMAWIVFFDQADLDSMIANSPALDRFLEEWASSGKLTKYGGSQAVRLRVIETLRPLSAVRAENSRRQLGISFHDLEISEVTDKEGTLKIVGLAARLASASHADRAEIEQAMKASVPICPHTEMPLTRGRDAMALIGVLLRKQIGTLNKHQAEAGFVERSMRLTLNHGDFGGAPFTGRLEAAVASVAVKPA